MCWMHEPGSSSWKKIAKLPVAIAGSAVATLRLQSSQEIVVALGGFTPGSNLDMPSQKLDLESDKKVFGYSDKILTWTPGLAFSINTKIKILCAFLTLIEDFYEI